MVSRFIVTASLFFCFITPHVILAGEDNRQKTADEATYGSVPRIGNTSFLPNLMIKDPFIQTSIQSTLGIGLAPDLKTPLLEIAGKPLMGLEGDLMFTMMQFEYQYAVTDWMAVWAQFRIAARLGSETQSLLTQGVTAMSGFELGWLFKLMRSKRSQLGATVFLWNTSSTMIDIYNFVRDAIEAGEIESGNKVIRTTPALSAGMGLHYAYAVSDMIGLTGILQLSYGEAYERKTGSELYYKAGLKASLDLNRAKDIPLGFSLAYVLNTVPELGDDIKDMTHFGVLNVSYTGRDDFNIGADFSFYHIPLERFDRSINFYSVLMNTKYFF